MFDSTSVKAAELLSYFGRNTAIRVDHDYGSNECAVVSARTGNVIALLGDLDKDLNLQECATVIMGMKKFPKNRKMNRTWSPIRLTAKAEADAEITRNTIAWSAE